MDNVRTENIDLNVASHAYYFNIADFIVKILFEDISKNNIDLLPSLNDFSISNNSDGNFLFCLYVVSVLPEIGICKNHIGSFDTGNGCVIVDKLENGEYLFSVNDICNNVCCELLTDKTFTECHCVLNGDASMRRFGLNNALMMIYAFAGSSKGALLIHASAIKYGDDGIAFIAKSGTGKSTHTCLWIKHIFNSELLNDDNPIIRMINDVPYLYGSPWSGKTPCYRNVKTKLRALVRIERGDCNHIKKLRPTEAFASILPCCSTMKWDTLVYDSICSNIIQIISKIDIYTLYCLPDRNAALLCHEKILNKKI